VRALVGLALAVFPLIAAEKITTGPPKLEVEAGAQEGPSWDPAGYLYFVGRNRVSRLNFPGGATRGTVDVFLDNVAVEIGCRLTKRAHVLRRAAAIQHLLRFGLRLEHLDPQLVSPMIGTAAAGYT
jgi:hypothetical protein